MIERRTARRICLRSVMLARTPLCIDPPSPERLVGQRVRLNTVLFEEGRAWVASAFAPCAQPALRVGTPESHRTPSRPSQLHSQ